MHLLQSEDGRALPLSTRLNRQLIGLPGFWAFPSWLSREPGGLGAKDGAFQANLLSACWQDDPRSTAGGLREREPGMCTINSGIYMLRSLRIMWQRATLVPSCLLIVGGVLFFPLGS